MFGLRSPAGRALLQSRLPLRLAMSALQNQDIRDAQKLEHLL